ncbi:probable membrane-associated kinase regulator 6 [Telopea speciosissima]|uniref:probable membrane-associated kinase regulator 6 n=1 Tax=Telopea speciosissima TaxID=54955 RepID=UPI001CC56C99|nr:probable membrane-associated kinase regulator 6 [Telopea speciosissima]
MEISERPLSIESFSKSWLINIRESSFDDSLVDDDPYDETTTAAFIELDPNNNWTPSKRFLSVPHDFSFDSNFASSPLFVVYADELFSNGLVMPIFINPSKIEASTDFIAESSPPPPPPTAISISISAKESSTGGLILSHGNGKMELSFLRRYMRSSKRIFHKYVSFVKPLYQKFRGSSRVCRSETESIDRIWGSSYCSTTDQWCDIDEAVLHCKKSFGT